MKMYILIKDCVPYDKAIVVAAHASLAMYLQYQGSDNVKKWLSGPFKKVVCKVSDSEFERAKKEMHCVVLQESSLDGIDVALAFEPRDEWPKMFQYLKLYKVEEQKV